MISKNNILILKNDRGGDLLNSISCISSLLDKNNKVTIYLSQFNIGFAFLFTNAKIKKINYNLSIFAKIKIFIFILINNFDEIYILTPKNYYYYLAFFFRKIKFYGITVDGVKRNRPFEALRSLMYKYVTISRKRINYKSSSDLQKDLIMDNKFKDSNFINIKTPVLKEFIAKNIPNKFLFIQYKDSFYKELNLSGKNFLFMLEDLIKTNDNIIFSSDIEKNLSNNFFYDQFNLIDCEKKIVKINKDKKNITYLHAIDSENLFAIINKASKIISPHGLVTHMCKFYNKKSLNLFNFKIKNKKDFIHQKIAFSEWYKNMNIKFVFLNDDVDRSLKKIRNKV